MKKVVVTGGDGQLGTALQKIAPQFNYYSKNNLDITNAKQVRSTVADADLVINLAAYTFVDLAEKEKQTAEFINVEGVKNLAKASRRLITLSTDYVFDGTKGSPYLEEDTARPLNFYGQTKLEGEKVALDSLKETIIVRSSWLFSPYKVNFVKRMVELSRERTELRVVSDQMGSPTSCIDLAQVLLLLVERFDQTSKGVFHYTNAGACSWCDLARETLKLKGSAVPVKAISTAEYPTAAARPKYSVLDTQKIQRELKISIPTWQEALRRVVVDI
jgi:dTDP-4-dehydrorhamnose reductase